MGRNTGGKEFHDIEFFESYISLEMPLLFFVDLKAWADSLESRTSIGTLSLRRNTLVDGQNFHLRVKSVLKKWCACAHG